MVLNLSSWAARRAKTAAPPEALVTAEEGLPALEVPALEVPVLQVPALEAPALEVPVVGIPVPEPLAPSPSSRHLGDPGSLAEIRPTPVRGGVGIARRRHDVVCDSFVVGDLQLAAASLRGLSHHVSGDGCQDAFAVGVTTDEAWLVAAIGDGVSSAELSEFASDLITRELLKAALGELEKRGDPFAVDWPGVVDAARQKLLDIGARLLAPMMRDEDGRRIEPAELGPPQVAAQMATTAELVIVRVRPNPGGGHPAFRLPIAGDSSIYILTPGAGWQVLAAGKDLDSEVASNAVVPLPLVEAPGELMAFELAGGQALALVTDGFGDVMADGQSFAGQHLQDRWANPLDVADFLDSCSFVVAGGEDDRTAVVVWTCP